MPTLANITVKKKDGTTDIVYTGLSRAAGDVPSVHRALTVGTADAHRPEFRLVSRDSKGGKSRAMRATYQYPQISTDTTTGVTSVVGTARASVDWDMPKDMASVDKGEFAYQFANLVASALMKQAVDEGYAPA